MTFRVALAALAVITASGAAHAQTVQAQPALDRVVVQIKDKPMPAVRAELAQAAEAVCRAASFTDERDVTCVDDTYAVALHKAKLARLSKAGSQDLTRVASR